MPPIGTIDASLTDLLDDAEWMAQLVRTIATDFLRADGDVALRLPDGTYVVVPGAVVALAPGAVGCLDPDDLERLAQWLLGTGMWTWRHRAPLLNILGARAPVQAALLGQPSPTLAVRVLGAAGGRLSMAWALAAFVIDAKDVVDQGNPFWAFRERGSNYIADYQQGWFDLSLGAFAARPHPITAAVAAATFTSWVAWATWDERRRVTEAAMQGADVVQDTVRNAVRGAVDDAADAARAWLDDQEKDTGGPDQPPFLPTWVTLARKAVDGVEETVDTVDDKLDQAADKLRKTGRKAKQKVDDAVDDALEAGGKLWDEGAEKVGDVFRR